MGKFKKIMAGIGFTACIATFGLAMTGCADMTDSQLKDALDTATKSELTLEELKDEIQTQNAKHNAQMSEYLDLLEQKNEEIAKLTEALSKSGEMSNEDAYNMIKLAMMKFKVMHPDVHNVTMYASMNGCPYYPQKQGGIVKLYKTNDDKLLYYSQVDGYDGYGAVCYGTYNEYTEIREIKTEKDYSIYRDLIDNTLLGPFSLGPLLSITSNDMVSAERSEEGMATIVSIHSSESGKEFNMITTVFDQNNNLIECIINKHAEYGLSDETYDYVEENTVTFEYGKITKTEADGVIEYINNY